jgi:CMP-N,N'-diacetyllegionaminic acid synthase
LRTLGIIPIKAASEKNFRVLGHQNLIEWTVGAAMYSRLDKTVAAIDTLDGPYLDKLDGTFPVHLGAYATPLKLIQGVLALEKEKPDGIVYLQVTSPLRSAEDIDACIDMLYEGRPAPAPEGGVRGAKLDTEDWLLERRYRKTPEHNLRTVMSVTQAEDLHPGHMYWDDGHFMSRPVSPRHEWGNRQSLQPKAFYRNGAIYAATTEAIERHTLRSSWCRPYVMPPERSVNIDTEWDWRMAEWLVGNTQH